MQAPWILQLIEQKGFSPLQEDMQRIAAIQSVNDVLQEVATEYNMDLSPVFSFYVTRMIRTVHR